jgi:hypothetical protein
MERLPSLINSLKSGYEAGKSTAELLSLLEEMRRELTGSKPLADHTQSPVSVWLPAGYQPLRREEVNTLEEETPAAAPVIREELPFISETIRESLQLPAEQQTDRFQAPAAAIPNGVPRPPQVTIIDEPLESSSPEILQLETPQDDAGDFVLPGNYHINPAGQFREKMPFVSSIETGTDEETPIVIELELNETEEEEPIQNTEPPAITIPEGFLKPATGPDTSVAARPRELHEILANRVVAQPARQEAVKQAPVLADKLSGGKITDLKKAIAINDRFRFIHSLFRGDDSLFERSVKTINNFSILQEAQYWIQRELVIKLGWNEEDELVQLFYHLVSRRFL